MRRTGLLEVGWLLEAGRGGRRNGFLGGVSRGEVLGRREERVGGVVF